MPTTLITARDVLRGHPATEDQYLRLALARAQQAGRALVPDARDVYAYVNDGWWKACCAHCGLAMVLHPDWAVVVCMGTGCWRLYRTIVWPEDQHAIEGELQQRPPRHQHWGRERSQTRDPQARVESIAELRVERERFGGREV